jgi:hypothetical protein
MNWICSKSWATRRATRREPLIVIVRNPLPLALLLIAVPGLCAATRETDLPDREMLKMMEFLREMEMVKHMELMRELDRAEALGETGKTNVAQKPPAAKKKETPK